MARRTRKFPFLPEGDLGLVLLSVIVGLAGGAGAIVFRQLIAWAQIMFSSAGEWVLPFQGQYYVILLPAVGLVLVSLIVRRWAPETRGHGVPEVQYAVRRLGGRIRPRVAAVKALASALTIGSGGSVGREGPIVQIGSSIGSSLGGLLGLRQDAVKTLVACGAAAGIGGTFNAPIAGVIFAMEVILGTFGGRSFGLVVIASVTSTALVQSVLGKQPAFALQEVFALVSPIELLLYVGLGIAAGLLAVAYVRALYFVERAFERSRWSPIPKAAVGGLLVGLIGYLGIRYLGGAHLFGVGYEGVGKALALGQESVSGEMGVLALMLLAGLKILATSTTLAAGGSGGVFAPALYIGAMAGGAFGLVANAVFPTVTAPAGAYALVGMGAVFGAAAHAPISAVLILFEMTDDYQIILPLMLAVVISYLLASQLHPDSIYSAKLRHLGGTLPLPLGRGSVLDLVRVIDAMTDHPELLRGDTSILEVATRFRDTNQRGFTVVDANGFVVGIVTATDVQSALIGGESNHLVAADIMTSNPICCTPDESLREVLQRISDQEISQVPVVDKEDPRRVVGLLRREQILWAIGEMASEHSRLLDEASPDRSENLVRLHVQIRREHRDACFKHVRELDIPAPCLVTEVRRAERSVVPKGDTLIEPGDVLAIVTARANESRVREWIARLDKRVSDTTAGP